MDKPLELPAKLMVLVSLVQGLCLLYLHQAIELHYWPHQQPQWLFALYSIAFIWPTMLLLGLNSDNTKAIVKLTLPFVLLSGLLGYYIGYQATPIEHIRYDAVLFSFVLTMAIATFKALMYSQQWAIGERVSYSALFLWSWRNFLTLSLSLLFAGCFWLILMLWGALFEAIDIHFFRDLFEERWFYYPAIALANGFGVIIFRRLTRIIDTITRLQQALMKFLLVVLVLVSLLFLTALPFTGLAPLWKSGGSSLILWMQALMLFFVNAVYQDEPDNWPYSKWLHRFIYLGVAALPLYSLISFYGLSLRVDQYGWSLSRYWAFLVWFLLALFPLGYWWGIARYRDGWVQQLSRVNVAIGLVVLGLMLAVNSPMMDFRKMVVADQMQRLAANEVSVDELDVRYFRQDLARPGYEALQSLKAEYAESHPNLVVRINAMYADHEVPGSTREEFIAAIEFLSNDAPDDLLTTLYKRESDNPWNMQNTQRYFLRALDVNNDGEMEYLWITQKQDWSSLTLYVREAESWAALPLLTDWNKSDNFDEFYRSLSGGDVRIEAPEWNDIVVGDIRLKIGLEE